MEQVAYILNNKTYLYILDFENNFEYTFYNEKYQVANIGRVSKAGHGIDEALDLIAKAINLNLHSIYKLNPEEFSEFADSVDDNQWVDVL